MPAINLPYDIQNSDPLDATKVMANEQTITALLNGSVDADNVQTAAPSIQPGNVTGAGVLATLLRSDATFTIQGVEELAALPTTGNRYGRLLTLSTDHKLYFCSNPAGSGTFIVIGNLVAADLVVHAAEHKDGGHDPLADLTITDHMKAARTIYSATQSADVNGISTTSYTTIVDLVLPAGILAQTLAIRVSAMVVNGAGSPRKVCLRVQDVTAGSTTIYRSKPRAIASTGGADQTDISEVFDYTLPAGGARTLRLQAGADGATVNIVKSATFNSDSFVPPNLEAVVI